MRALRRLGLLLGGCLVAVAAVMAADGDAPSGSPLAIPALTARVTDLTGTLDAQQKQTLESELAALEQRKGSQLGVLIVPTTQPEDIAQYGIRVGDAWKLGRKSVDDGAILIIAKNDHQVRIEVGRGLEGAIPDAASARIIREFIAPKFRANDYYGGIEDAVGALSKLVDGEPLPPPLTDDRDLHHRNGGGDMLNAVLFAFFAILWARAMFGRLPGAPRGGLVAAIGGGAAWLLSGGAIPLALGLGAVGLVLGLLGGGGGGFANRGGWGGFPGIFPGNFGGGFGGGGFGGGGGGGGFSGGGGSFGGGGASGSW